MAGKRRTVKPIGRDAFIAVTGRPPSTAAEYELATGLPPDWRKGWPEDLRGTIKLNVRITRERAEHVRRMAKRLKCTLSEVVLRAITALEEKLAVEDAEQKK